MINWNALLLEKDQVFGKGRNFLCEYRLVTDFCRHASFQNTTPLGVIEINFAPL